jgi:hypothetical protein
MITLFGIIGLVVVSISIWVKKEKRQDLFFILGGLFLLVHSIGIKSWIFSILQIVFIVSALIEFLKLRRRRN